MNDENYYTTSDLALVALLSLTFPIERLTKTNPKKIIFSFKTTIELQVVVDQYWRRETRVEPQAYFNQIRVVKNMIYDN